MDRHLWENKKIIELPLHKMSLLGQFSWVDCTLIMEKIQWRIYQFPVQVLDFKKTVQVQVK